MVRRNATGHDVEARVGTRKMVGRRDHVRLHAGRRIDGDDLRTGLAQAPCDMPSTGGDVQDGDIRPRLAPLDDQVEIVSGRMRGALAVGLGPVAPEIAHAASSTARRAPSSIVASGWMFSR